MRSLNTEGSRGVRSLNAEGSRGVRFLNTEGSRGVRTEDREEYQPCHDHRAGRGAVVAGHSTSCSGILNTSPNSDVPSYDVISSPKYDVISSF